jgi:hypothetical protein
MTIRKLKNGNLEMTADSLTIADIKNLLTLDDPEYRTMIDKERFFVDAYLSNDPAGDGISYEQVSPQKVGALTNAPLISDGHNIYGFMDYAVTNFLEDLANGDTITWIKG